MLPPDPVRSAVSALRQGRLVCVFDEEGREEETDLLGWGGAFTPSHVERLRKDAGGLVFCFVDPRVADRLGMPFLEEVLDEGGRTWPVLEGLVDHDLAYDSRSSFSVPINHRGTFTGITDEDRALTIRTLAELAEATAGTDRETAREAFADRFRAPGHVATCVAADGLLDERRGHTELGVALLRLAGLAPVGAGAEMLASGTRLPRDEAREYARTHGLPFVTGREIRRAWRTARDATAWSVPADLATGT